MEKMRRTILVFLGAAGCLTGCGQEASGPPSTASAPGASAVPEAKAEGPTAIDPVCEMKVPTSGPVKTDYQGKTYHFCGPACKNSFEKDPARYSRPEAGKAQNTNPKSR